MRTFVIEGKPLEEVTIKVKGQSLTLTEGVEVTVIVVVASQQERAIDAAYWACKKCESIVSDKFDVCGLCKTPRN